VSSIDLIHQAVLRSAERAPDSPALKFSATGLTYAELVARASRVARALIDLGVRPGDRVAFYMNKCLESVVSIYGILLAGGVYVPLDPFAPPARLAFVLRDCGVRVLLTQPAKATAVSEILAEGAALQSIIGLPDVEGQPLTCLPWASLESASPEPPGLRFLEGDLAYILYTSGSTGTPKGIMHTHRSGLSFAEWAVQTYNVRSTDRLSNHAPYHFDLSTFDLFASALAGAATVIIPEPYTKLPASLSKLMQDERISVWYSVPFALIQLLQHGNLASRDLSALRWVLFAGEPFPTKHLRAVMAEMPGARFSNLYGPTETNVCTYYHVPPLDPDSDEPIPIGRACENVEDLVVDADHQPVPPGEPGELLIRGAVVMRGYWGQPEMTQRGFYRRATHGFLEDLFYRTGDLVQLQPDGNYKFLGRKDRQIKTRGYRVELDEIETALLSHPGVDEAAVYPIPDGQGSNLIEAGVILKEGAVAQPADLIDWVAGRLPPYAVPARIFITPDFPRTSTGKINRRELQARAAEGQAR
jgi:amino acid adenylation domain-containing protein